MYKFKYGHARQKFGARGSRTVRLQYVSDAARYRPLEITPLQYELMQCCWQESEWGQHDRGDDI